MKVSSPSGKRESNSVGDWITRQIEFTIPEGLFCSPYSIDWEEEKL